MARRISAFKTESITVGVIYPDWNENENDRIRNRVESDFYNDVVDIMEGEYNISRGSPRGEVAGCVTFDQFIYGLHFFRLFILTF
jgi:hypothetical protein